MNVPPQRLRRIIKGRILALLDAILAAIALKGWPDHIVIVGVNIQGLPSTIVAILLILIFVLSSFLALYIYKFKVANKALLQINPNFYQEKEFAKWFDYYVEKNNEN